MTRNEERELAIVILAAGLGKRLKTSIPKVLHEAGGLPLIHHVLRAAGEMNHRHRTLVVVGHGRDEVAEAIKKVSDDAELVDQPQQRGTADAVSKCVPLLEGFDGEVVVLMGDVPLLRGASLDLLVEAHRKEKADATLLTINLPFPHGYGRIVRDHRGRFVRIVEEADADENEKAIKEVSTGIWCFRAKPLFGALDKVRPDNAQQEYYLTDAAFIIASEGGIMYTQSATDPTEVMGVNDQKQLWEATRHLRLIKNEKLAASGVVFEDPESAYIDEAVEVGPETLIRPNVYLRGMTRIGARCTVGPEVDMVDTIVGDEAQILFAVTRESEIGPRSEVGPFAYLRPGTKLAEGAKIGTFVEVVRSTIGEGSRVPHLSYVGDTTMGKDVNLGAGTITGNYDGETEIKSQTVIEDGVDTGSGTTIVAPATLGEEAVTAAGSVVTRDVEARDVVVGIPAKPFRKRKEKLPEKGQNKGDRS